MEENHFPMARLAVFIDGWNFKYATYDAFGIQVDFVKLLDYLTRRSILIRAYYYTGEWTTDSIDQYVKLSTQSDLHTLKAVSYTHLDVYKRQL